MKTGSISNESSFEYNTACPACREVGKDQAGDNLAIYSDGHSFCWCCGFHRNGNGNVTRGIRDVSRTDLSSQIVLPEDCSIDYKGYQVAWIHKYGLDIKDLHALGAVHSEAGIRFNGKKHGLLVADNCLIFPIWGNGLEGFQGRYFGIDKRIPKWIGKGKLNQIYNILPGNKSHKDVKIVLVEDIISAYKVSLVGHTTMPLYGMNAVSRFDTLKLLGYKDIVLWLDPNMKKEMIRQGRQATLKGFNYQSIFSEYDPKEHSLSEIRKYLTDNL